MKWYTRHVNMNNHKAGDKRVIKCFLWFPHGIDGTVKWMETVYIEQKIVLGLFASDAIWKDVQWKTKGDLFIDNI